MQDVLNLLPDLQMEEGDPCEEDREPDERRNLVLHSLWPKDEAVPRNHQSMLSYIARHY